METEKNEERRWVLHTGNQESATVVRSTSGWWVVLIFFFLTYGEPDIMDDIQYFLRSAAASLLESSGATPNH